MKMWKQIVAAIAVGTALIAAPCISDAAVLTPKKTTSAKVMAKGPVKASTKTPSKPLARHVPVKAPLKKTVAVKAAASGGHILSAHKVLIKKRALPVKLHKPLAKSKKPALASKKPGASSHVALAGAAGANSHPTL